MLSDGSTHRQPCSPLPYLVAYWASLRIAAAPAASFINAAVTIEYGRADRLPSDNHLTLSVALQL